MKMIRTHIDRAGRFPVQQIPCPHYDTPVILTAPRTGVLHTTEGGWEGSVSGVFKRHYAPHFVLGMDEKDKRVEIAQLVPVGVIGAACKAHNNQAIVQIEMIGYAQEKLWLPDAETLDALASLMLVCRDEYGIPLSHPWKDGDFGRASDNPHRHAGFWGKVPGWYGHGDCPLPDSHWDPGALQWSKVFDRAKDIEAEAKKPAPVTPPKPADKPSDAKVS